MLNKMYNKKIDLITARLLSKKFCKDFDIPNCQIFFVDYLEGGHWGEYINLIPCHILIVENHPNRIGVLMHELTHHLENANYDNYENSSHGYSYQLAKGRVVTWCRKNISKKPNWYLPLQGRFDPKEMVKFKL